ncbi:hypothetical protein OU415_14565 [Saccharopolyspora sp. WRP15-2]|uniref:Uncharacterized protein n=1 Tax=Saccharopolyspora oryzae TaxID=2997343 RepID=A0ABT4UY79_9PSEU|nr:hypothetical protein [Saccharopolyspora oryzae]MDA3626666.1 hypothetical protein [Saccharopolyspora oryzae]
MKRTLANVKKFAGEPAVEETRWLDGERATSLIYHFEPWPEFDFEVVGDANGFWIDGGFVRREDSEVPHVEAPEELEPWRHLLSEVRERFGPLEEGDLWYPFEDHGLESRGADDVMYEYDVKFSWRMLQMIRVDPRWPDGRPA